MKPVYQIDNQCFAACVASVFELPLSAVPCVDPDKAKQFWSIWRKWFRQHNLDIDFFRTDKHELVPNCGIVLLDYYNNNAEDEDNCHVVVARDREIIHDPKRGKAKKGWPWKLRGYYSFRVIDPAQENK